MSDPERRIERIKKERGAALEASIRGWNTVAWTRLCDRRMCQKRSRMHMRPRPSSSAVGQRLSLVRR